MDTENESLNHVKENTLQLQGGRGKRHLKPGRMSTSGEGSECKSSWSSNYVSQFFVIDCVKDFCGYVLLVAHPLSGHEEIPWEAKQPNSTYAAHARTV